MLKQALHKSERRYADYTFFSGIVCTQAINFQVLLPNKHLLINVCRLPVADGEQCQVKFGQNEIRFHQVNIEDRILPSTFIFFSTKDFLKITVVYIEWKY